MADYVLITPAHNEAKLIGATLESVVQQTIRPKRWVIVDDASSDKTCEVVKPFCDRYPFIRLVSLEDRSSGRNFENKALAFNRGLDELSDLSWDYIGNLDADIRIEPDYYENI